MVDLEFEILIDGLKEIIDHLKKHDPRWAANVEKDHKLIAVGNFKGVKDYLGNFGAMGSLTDQPLDEDTQYLLGRTHEIAEGLTELEFKRQYQLWKKIKKI